MLREFRSNEAARSRFDELASIEPRLAVLWRMCADVTGPELPDDEPVDQLELDPIAERPEDGWCAEDHFLRNIKPYLLPLVGWQRREDPPELQASDAYDDAYSALFHHALPRPCTCCRLQ